MKTIKVNIGNDPILIDRAKAEAGDPRAYSQGNRKNADIKVTLISREFNKTRQKTFYLVESLGNCHACGRELAVRHPVKGITFCDDCAENARLPEDEY